MLVPFKAEGLRARAPAGSDVADEPSSAPARGASAFRSASVTKIAFKEENVGGNLRALRLM
jgi:hypothetical protein